MDITARLTGEGIGAFLGGLFFIYFLSILLEFLILKRLKMDRPAMVWASSLASICIIGALAFRPGNMAGPPGAFMSTFFILAAVLVPVMRNGWARFRSKGA